MPVVCWKGCQDAPNVLEGLYCMLKPTCDTMYLTEAAQAVSAGSREGNAHLQPRQPSGNVPAEAKVRVRVVGRPKRVIGIPGAACTQGNAHMAPMGWCCRLSGPLQGTYRWRQMPRETVLDVTLPSTNNEQVA